MRKLGRWRLSVHHRLQARWESENFPPRSLRSLSPSHGFKHTKPLDKIIYFYEPMITSIPPLPIRGFGLVLLSIAVWCLASCDRSDLQPAAPERTVLIDPPLGENPLRLVETGETRYRVVRPDAPTEVDQYAIEQWTGYMKAMTGADFVVIDGSELGPEEPAVFLGDSAAAWERLGRNPLAELEPQEHVARTHGEDLFLFGEGPHGSLHAAMEFLETSMGWRWYSRFVEPVLPEQPEVALPPFARIRGFDFAYRMYPSRWGSDFYYQHGINQGLEGRPGRENRNLDTPFQSRIRDESSTHSLFSYIRPNTTVKGHAFPWVDKDDYFATNPEFFSMNEQGNRVPNMQLEFGNPALRAELTRRVIEHIDLVGEPVIISVTAHDTPGAFSHSPESKALEEKYQSPGGPLYDYLIELCRELQQTYPGAKVKTLAYRRSQTQKPPVLPEGEMLPDNLIIDFAPIEDNFFADWTHPDERIQGTLADLKSWAKITPEGNLWAWIYPNPWGSGALFPVGNIERLITNLRIMHEVGVRGVFADHNGFISQSDFSELQLYLYLNLLQDVNADTDALIEEFTDHIYGAAGPGIRQYLKELEAERREMEVSNRRITYKTREDQFDLETFPYLTAENLRRWHKEFDAMEELVADNPRDLINVRRARRELDYATLNFWADVTELDPGYFADHQKILARIESVHSAEPMPGTAPRALSLLNLEDILLRLEAGGKEKPLPEPFASMPSDRVRTILPTNHGAKRAGQLPAELDPDAAFGLGVLVDQPESVIQAIFHQHYPEGPKKWVTGARIQIKPDDSGEYRLHKLGRIQVTPNCRISMGKSQQTNTQLGERLYEPGAGNEWDAYVSVKFPIPKEGEEPIAYTDRIILVRISEDQFATDAP